MITVVGQGPPEIGPTVATAGLTSKAWLLKGFANSPCHAVLPFSSTAMSQTRGLSGARVWPSIHSDQRPNRYQ